MNEKWNFSSASEEIMEFTEENPLEKLSISQNSLIDVNSLIWRFYKANNKSFPRDKKLYFIAGYYIISRHPLKFPVHETIEDFSRIYKIDPEILEKCVEEITRFQNYIRIKDDMNFPYYIDSRNDIIMGFIKSLIKSKVDSAVWNYITKKISVEAEKITEKIVDDIIFKHKGFPGELSQQLFEIILQLVEGKIKEYQNYIKENTKYLP